MKKLLLFLFMSLSYVCFAQKTYDIKINEDFFGEITSEMVKTRVVKNDSTLTIYEKHGSNITTKTFYIIQLHQDDPENCVELSPGVYGYDDVYAGYELKTKELYALTFRVITTRYSCSYLRDCFIVCKVVNGELQDKVTYGHNKDISN